MILMGSILSHCLIWVNMVIYCLNLWSLDPDYTMHDAPSLITFLLLSASFSWVLMSIPLMWINCVQEVSHIYSHKSFRLRQIALKILCFLNPIFLLAVFFLGSFLLGSIWFLLEAMMIAAGFFYAGKKLSSLLQNVGSSSEFK